MGTRMDGPWLEGMEEAMRAWSQSQRTLWETWSEAAKDVVEDPDDPRARAAQAWQELLEQGLEQWEGAGDAVTARVVDQTTASQRAVTRFLERFGETWETLAPVVAEGGDWRKTLEEVTAQLQADFSDVPAGSRAAEASGDLAELWKLYLNEVQRVSELWFAPLDQPKSGAPPASTVHRLIDRYWNAFDRTLGQGLDSPTIGYSRETNSRILTAFKRWTELRRAEAEYLPIVASLWVDAFRKVVETYVGKVQAGEPPQEMKDLVNLWVHTADEVFVEGFTSSEYVAAQARVLNASMAYRQKERELLESLLNAQGLPTRTELDETHRTIYELRREIRALKERPKERRDVSELASQVEELRREVDELRAGQEPVPGPEALPVAGYDELNARDAIRALEGLSRDDVEAVRRHEQANKGRKTVLEAANRELKGES